MPVQHALKLNCVEQWFPNWGAWSNIKGGSARLRDSVQSTGTYYDVVYGFSYAARHADRPTPLQLFWAAPLV